MLLFGSETAIWHAPARCTSSKPSYNRLIKVLDPATAGRVSVATPIGARGLGLSGAGRVAGVVGAGVQCAPPGNPVETQRATAPRPRLFPPELRRDPGSEPA